MAKSVRRGLLFLGLCITSSAAEAQSTIAYFHMNRVKPGASGEYEATRKRHWLWHQKLGETWTYYVWQIVTGADGGAYVISSFDHSWKEADESERVLAGDEDPSTDVGPYLESSSESYYRFHREMSVGPNRFVPANKLAVVRLVLQPDRTKAFIAAMRQVADAVRNANQPTLTLRCYELVTGGAAPQFLLLSDRANWEAYDADIETLLESTVKKAYGQQRGEAIWRTVWTPVKSKTLETWQYRPDLSHEPDHRTLAN